jgi:hypothetical protein
MFPWAPVCGESILSAGNSSISIENEGGLLTPEADPGTGDGFFDIGAVKWWLSGRKEPGCEPALGKRVSK